MPTATEDDGWELVEAVRERILERHGADLSASSLTPEEQTVILVPEDVRTRLEIFGKDARAEARSHRPRVLPLQDRLDAAGAVHPRARRHPPRLSSDAPESATSTYWTVAGWRSGLQRTGCRRSPVLTRPLRDFAAGVAGRVSALQAECASLLGAGVR